MLNVARFWYRREWHIATWLLLPFSWIFFICVNTRRFLYRVGLLRSHPFSVPVIVVGNITVGGTGKTPLVIWLANFLRSQGYSPGVISRGYGGKRHVKPFWVQTDSSPKLVGDEALLLARHANCPVVIGVDRAADARELLNQSNCNIVITDDGLQHYRLKRDVEIAVVDGARRFGNQCLLPAGPLREPLSRLNEVDLVFVNDGLTPVEWVSVKSQQKMALDKFAHTKVHAVAGIGHPERFFDLLRKMGLEVVSHVFPDHYAIGEKDLNFNDALPIVMTEKDAVKCEAFADDRYWYLAVTANIDEVFKQKLLQSLEVRDEHKDEFKKHSYDVDYSMRHGGVRE